MRKRAGFVLYGQFKKQAGNDFQISKPRDEAKSF